MTMRKPRALQPGDRIAIIAPASGFSVEDFHAGLFELEGGTLVTHTSSFSKTAAPGLRTGYFVLPDDRAAAYEEHFFHRGILYMGPTACIFRPTPMSARSGARAAPP